MTTYQPVKAKATKPDLGDPREHLGEVAQLDDGRRFEAICVWVRRADAKPQKNGEKPAKS
jgi:hypothetical protein